MDNPKMAVFFSFNISWSTISLHSLFQINFSDLFNKRYTGSTILQKNAMDRRLNQTIPKLARSFVIFAGGFISLTVAKISRSASTPAFDIM